MYACIFVWRTPSYKSVKCQSNFKEINEKFFCDINFCWKLNAAGDLSAHASTKHERPFCTLCLLDPVAVYPGGWSSASSTYHVPGWTRREGSQPVETWPWEDNKDNQKPDVSWLDVIEVWTTTRRNPRKLRLMATASYNLPRSHLLSDLTVSMSVFLIRLHFHYYKHFPVSLSFRVYSLSRHFCLYANVWALAVMTLDH